MSTTGPSRQVLQTPRAAGLVGVAFALLLAAAIVLIRLGLPEGAEAVPPEGLTDPARRSAVRTALTLVPFAGIFFLWFLGVVRTHVGDAEDKFLATVLLGSGLVFVATMFGAAAAAAAVLATAQPSGIPPGPPTWDFGRNLAYTLMTGYAMRMAAVFTASMSTIGHRLGLLPRWLTLLGFLTALTLLFVSTNFPWSELVFPAWSLIISLHILVANRRPRSGAPAAS
ncbi:hypothetical protein [Streptomyces sp. TP-A0356]|uniref:hypothetical protein n=1 Tax=Streptomyces sp. TP-A0356 TaxID=1359208 RepID=UPI0006E282B5|nr:hypothetical protein [Streptomyces sp. TP-A0356]